MLILSSEIAATRRINPHFVRVKSQQMQSICCGEIRRFSDGLKKPLKSFAFKRQFNLIVFSKSML